MAVFRNCTDVEEISALSGIEGCDGVGMSVEVLSENALAVNLVLAGPQRLVGTQTGLGKRLSRNLSVTHESAEVLPYYFAIEFKPRYFY